MRAVKSLGVAVAAGMAVFGFAATGPAAAARTTPSGPHSPPVHATNLHHGYLKALRHAKSHKKIILRAQDTVTVTNPGNQSTYQHGQLKLQVHGSSSGGNPLTWSATGLPGGLTINSATGLVTGDIKAAPATYSVTVTATDTTNASGSSSFSWKVKANVGGPVQNATGKCLDDNDYWITSGNPVDIWRCNSTAAQKWTHPANPGELIVLGQCLTDPGSGGGDTMQVIQPCTGASNQIWNHNLNSEYVLKVNGLCLTDPSGITTNGTRVEARACRNHKDQHWSGS